MPLRLVIFFCCPVVVVKFTFYSYSCFNVCNASRGEYFSTLPLGVFFFTLSLYNSLLCLHEFPYCLQSGFKINIFVVYVFTRFLSFFLSLFSLFLCVSSYTFAHSVFFFLSFFFFLHFILKHSTNK